jgi:hypothetical protein
MLAINFLAEGVVLECFPSLNDVPQSHIEVLDSVSSPNCALSLAGISADFTFLLVRNLVIIRSKTADGNTCSFTVTTTDKKQADAQRYAITVIGIPSPTTGKVILFCVEISEL